jgi:hypothetical protein
MIFRPFLGMLSGVHYAPTTRKLSGNQLCLTFCNEVLTCFHSTYRGNELQKGVAGTLRKNIETMHCVSREDLPAIPSH